MIGLVLYLILSGIFLIADGIVSIILRQENKVLKKKHANLYQPGRVIRAGIGVANLVIGLLLSMMV